MWCRLKWQVLISIAARPLLNSLDEALQSLKTTLEDYQGQYAELQELEEEIQYLDRVIQKASSGGTLATEGLAQSESNASIENALGAFDFLEHEDYLYKGPCSSKYVPMAPILGSFIPMSALHLGIGVRVWMLSNPI
jgi:hypothetical protein